MKPKWKRRLKILGVVVLAVVAALVVVVQTGLAERWARRAIIARIEQMTGGRVELKAFLFSVLRLRA